MRLVDEFPPSFMTILSANSINFMFFFEQRGRMLGLLNADMVQLAKDISFLPPLGVMIKKYMLATLHPTFDHLISYAESCNYAALTASGGVKYHFFSMHTLTITGYATTISPGRAHLTEVPSCTVVIASIPPLLVPSLYPPFRDIAKDLFYFNTPTSSASDTDTLHNPSSD